MKNAKKAQKLQKAVEELKTARGPRRRWALEKAVKAAGPDTQEGRSYAFMLVKENLMAEDSYDDFARQLGVNAEAQPRQIARAAAPAILSATTARHLSPSERRARSDPRRSLQTVLTGDYQRGSLPLEETELASQTRIREAEVNLQKAATPEARAEWSYRLTRERLVAGHRRGEI